MFFHLGLKTYLELLIYPVKQTECHITDKRILKVTSGLSHPFLGMGPGLLELGKIALTKIGKKILSFMHRSFNC